MTSLFILGSCTAPSCLLAISPLHIDILSVNLLSVLKKKYVKTKLYLGRTNRTTMTLFGFKTWNIKVLHSRASQTSQIASRGSDGQRGWKRAKRVQDDATDTHGLNAHTPYTYTELFSLLIYLLNPLCSSGLLYVSVVDQAMLPLRQVILIISICPLIILPPLPLLPRFAVRAPWGRHVNERGTNRRPTNRGVIIMNY